MSKSGLVEQIVEDTGVSKAEAGRQVDAVFQALSTQLRTGASVTIPGFGKFELKDTPARSGRNPQTGEHMDIPARTTVRFKVGAPLKRALEE